MKANRLLIPLLLAALFLFAGQFVYGQRHPEPLNLDSVKAHIVYPELAKDAEIEGRVILKILVDEQGRYNKHKVLRSTHPILTKAVEKEIRTLICEVGFYDDRPVKYWTTIPFDFKLK